MKPDLRFPEFKVDWEKKRLGSLSSQSMYGIGASAIEFDNQNVYVRITDIDEDTRKITGDYASPDTIDEKYLLEKNDILFARTGASTGKTYIHSKFDQTLKYYFAGFLIKFKIKDSYSSKFIYQYTFTEMYKNWVKVMSVRSGQPGINSEEYSKLSLYIPKKDEQEKIGIFFNKLDRQIELEEEKLELLEQQKRGYMQKIFSQEIRFKDENGNDYPDWKEQKLEELGRFNSGVGFPEKYQGGNLGTPFFKVSDMNLPANKTFMNMANNYVTDQQINEKKWKVINDVPAVIFAKVGAAIMLNRKRMVIEPFLMDNNTMSYSFSTHWDTNFGNIFFQTLNLPKYAQVGALPSYNSKDIGTISVNLPSLSEQQKIGDFFSKLDIFIEKQSDKIELLKERKKGFLQKMFI